MYIHPPFVSYDDKVIYPVLKEEGAKGGVLNTTHPKQLMMDFNCLGIEGKTTIVLHILTPLHSPIQLLIDKECSKETLLDKIEENIIDEEEQYGFLKLICMTIFILAILYSILTCYNMYNGKPFAEAVPCGKSCIEQLFGSCIV